MPLPQLHFMMSQLPFSSRENKGVNEAKTWTLCWPAHLAREEDDTTVPPTPAFMQLWERKLVIRNMDPY